MHSIDLINEYDVVKMRAKGTNNARRLFRRKRKVKMCITKEVMANGVMKLL